MKYNKLTKEQFEELHEEFAMFLAAQSIDEKEWTRIKKDKPEIADKEMEVFSDFVWERVLRKAEYLEHFSQNSINLFKCGADQIDRIVVKVNKEDVNLLDSQGFEWFVDHSHDPRIEYLKGKKSYQNERNQDLFDLIQKGSVVSDGKLYEAIAKLISA